MLSDAGRLFSPSVMAASIFVFLLVLGALVPEWLTTMTQDKNELANALFGSSAEHPPGTDNLGRDLYTRIVFGARC